MRSLLAAILFFNFSGLDVFGQVYQPDSTLREVVVQAYVSGRPLSEVPAAVGYLDSAALNRFSNTSLLPAANMIPGVRMEERSPGSYRFSIRGSLLRSPFGVRNVKIYWNGVPLTDAGGNTYLNLIDFQAIDKFEVIKGPAGSLYGAGTGGVVLMNSLSKNERSIEVSSTIGNFGLLRYGAKVTFGNDKVTGSINYAHQQSNGFRENSSINRDFINANVKFLLSPKSTLAASLFYSDLMYETPGGLTPEQFEEDPSQARPAAGMFRSAEEQRASISNKTPFASLNYTRDWTTNFTSEINVFGFVSDFANPAIANYEERDEHNGGVRITSSYRSPRGHKFSIGTELQSFNSARNVYDNFYGSKGANQSSEELDALQGIVFSQADLQFNNLFVTFALGLNQLKYSIERFAVDPIRRQSTFYNELTPRAAVLHKFKFFSLYANVSRGFSPPSLAEVLPSTNVIYKDLKPEVGTSFEAGLKASQKRFEADLCVYQFSLKNTIVPRTIESGQEYFVNAGQTSQTGVELLLSWNATPKRWLTMFKVWNSFSYNHYRFTEYEINNENFAGNKLTGVPPLVNTTGIDLTVFKNGYLNATCNFVDRIPLNDANTFFADSYLLVSYRLGWKFQINSTSLELFSGVTNLFNEVYSLGNDLNARFGRYFNAAAPRTSFVGLTCRLK